MTVRPFTPVQEPIEDLVRRTVGRDQLLSVLAERLRLAATTRTRQHTLLVGPRGSGKTHLLQVALYFAMNDPEVGPGLAIARIAEDAVGVNSYVDLLRELARSLGLDVGRERDLHTLENDLLSAAGDRTLVIVIENLDRVFRSLGVDGQRDLRSWVETSGRILILAATPALFESVRNRKMPWFGGLIETPVEGLTAEEGRELLIRLAEDQGDQPLVEALKSDWGKARVQALSQLTAGSPRIWMVLSGCLTVESLDELIPAVEELVESLVPYYQSLLWDLSDNQQAIVRQLAEGGSAAMTASEIAAETGLSQQTVSKALGLLKEGRWVRDEKLASDQRHTFYSLREPMLRHHFQWRATHGEPLRLIVDLLREWYDQPDLLRHLGTVEPGSPSERYVAETLRFNPPGYDFAENVGTPEALLEVARVWMRCGDPVYPAETGLYAELCALLAQDPTIDTNGLVQHRTHQYPLLGYPPSETVTILSSEAAVGIGLPELLLTSAKITTGDVSASLILIAAGFIGRQTPQRSFDLLGETLTKSESALGLAIALERAFWMGQKGDTQDAFTVVTSLLPTIKLVLGADNAMTLTARSNLAELTGETGDPATALHLYQQLLPDNKRVLGPDDRATLTTRSQVAYYTGETGDPTTALHLYQELLPDRERVLGPDHPDTLITRGWIAYYTGETGDPTTALHLYQELLPDAERIMGLEDDLTVFIRAAIRRLSDQSGISQLLERARDGDQDALLRLPSELRPLAEGRTTDA